MSDHVIVWDLETVPDIAGYAAANGLIGQSNEEIRESLGNKFPKHIYHSIVCIGARCQLRDRSTNDPNNSFSGRSPTCGAPIASSAQWSGSL